MSVQVQTQLQLTKDSKQATKSLNLASKNVTDYTHKTILALQDGIIDKKKTVQEAKDELKFKQKAALKKITDDSNKASKVAEQHLESFDHNASKEVRGKAQRAALMVAIGVPQRPPKAAKAVPVAVERESLV